MNLLNSLPEIRELPFPLFNRVSIILINFIVAVLIFTVVNHTKKKKSVDKLFLLMSISQLIWVDGAYFARLFGNNEFLALALLRLAWFATPFLFYVTYLTSVNLLHKQEKFKKVSLILGILVAGISLITLTTPFVVSGFKFTNGILDIIYGFLFYPYLFTVILTIVATIFSVRKSHPTKGELTFLIGVSIFYFLNAIFNITLPVFLHLTNLYFIGDYSTIFLLIATTYAILRHKLFDIKVFATELLTVSIWAVLFIRIFLYSNSGAQSFFDLGVFIVTVFLGILVIRSVNTEVRQKNELRRLANELRAIDQKKDEFISMAAHELRAPLTAIKGFLSMVIGGDAGEISTQAKEFLTDSSVSAERMIRLVNNMLNVGRIEEGRLVYNPEIVSLSKISNDVFSEFKGEAERKALQFSVEVKDGISDTVYVDQDKLHEVIVNFVSNAIKYTDHGFVKIRVVSEFPNIARVEVVDSGSGISDEEQKKLFHKFYRVESKVGKTIGTGLGLYISKLLVEKFGGKIGVTSVPEKGSTFWFELPTRRVDNTTHHELPLQKTT